MTRHETILSILKAVYGNAQSQLSLQTHLTYRIEDLLDAAKTDTHRQSILKREVTNVLWMNYSGGDTASNAADDIFEALEMDEDFLFANLGGGRFC